MKFVGSIEKTYKDDKGFLIVCGHASTEAVDSQGEVVKREAMEGALVDYMKFANIREMHQPSAVGKCLMAKTDDNGTYIEVKVVDPTAAMKCEEGVYSGFSIGGKATKREDLNKSVITGLRLTEISLVDRPANPEAVFTMFKADDIQEDDVTEVKKGMDHVAHLAYLLKELGYLVNDQADEAQREGDDSKVPAFLQAWLVQGAEILKTMTAEETAELVNAAGQNLLPEAQADAMAADAATQDVQLMDHVANIAKAGAKFSSLTRAQLLEVKSTLENVMTLLAGLGFDAVQTDVNPETAQPINVGFASPEGTGDGIDPLNSDQIAQGDNGAMVVRADTEEDMKKLDELTKTHEETLAKVASLDKTHEETLAKVASLEETITKLAEDKDTLVKRVAELEAITPAPDRIKLVTLTKAEDAKLPSDKQAFTSKVETLAQSDDATDVMKAIHLVGARAGIPK